jgi:hypothetical protein
MKDNARYQEFAAKILHQSNRYNKVAFVVWFVDQPLTSGEIQKVLSALDDKMSLPNVSMTLKNESAKFMLTSVRTSGGLPPKYKLTAKARADFENWLAGSGTSDRE